MLTGAFEDTDPEIGDELQAIGVASAQFFTNALDTKTQGIDIVLSYNMTLGVNPLKLSLIGNFNDMELGQIHVSPALAGKEDIYFGDREEHFLVASAPPSKINFAVQIIKSRSFPSTCALCAMTKLCLSITETRKIFMSRRSRSISLLGISSHLISTSYRWRFQSFQHLPYRSEHRH